MEPQDVLGLVSAHWWAEPGPRGLKTVNLLISRAIDQRVPGLVAACWVGSVPNMAGCRVWGCPGVGVGML